MYDENKGPHGRLLTVYHVVSFVVDNVCSYRQKL